MFVLGVSVTVVNQSARFAFKWELQARGVRVSRGLGSPIGRCLNGNYGSLRERPI